MKMLSPLRSQATQVASTFLLLTLLSSCELPPREAWRIIQRDGLITYWSRDYHPTLQPSRYLASNGRPLQPARTAYVPYRPESQRNRYLADQPRVYRPRPQVDEAPRYERPARREPAVVATPKIPVDSGTVKPQPKTAPDAAPKIAMDTLPYGTPVEGRPGMVTSPFAGKQQLVDVTGMAPGEAVKDPYSGKLFRVPPTQQARASQPAPAPSPAPAEAPPEAKEEAKPQP